MLVIEEFWTFYQRVKETTAQNEIIDDDKKIEKLYRVKTQQITVFKCKGLIEE